jgi:hypothetical protein
MLPLYPWGEGEMQLRPVGKMLYSIFPDRLEQGRNPLKYTLRVPIILCFEIRYVPPPPFPLLPIISRFFGWRFQSYEHRGKSFALFDTTFHQIKASILKFDQISVTNYVLILKSVMLTFSNSKAYCNVALFRHLK